MTALVFIEGVSGVGKSTMVHMLTDELKSLGYNGWNKVYVNEEKMIHYEEEKVLWRIVTRV